MHTQLQTQPVTRARGTAAAALQAVGYAGAAAGAAAADPCLDLGGVQAKAVGSLLAAMCGNALGAQVEPEKVSSGSQAPPGTTVPVTRCSSRLLQNSRGVA